MAQRNRLLLKVSGEAFGSSDGRGAIGEEAVDRIAREIVVGVRKADSQVALVVGGGNFLRGRDAASGHRDRLTADHMGMLATVLNGLALRSALEHNGVEARVLSAVRIDPMGEYFVPRHAIQHLEAGRILVLVGGTGLPYFSTDSTAALRALEINSTRLLKGTGVRGIFSADPRKDPNASFFDELTFDEFLRRDLKVIDATAASLCRDHDLPIEVFDMTQEGNITRAICGERLGTLLSKGTG